MRLLRVEDKRHRAAAINALTPVMNAYTAGEITAEEYESFVGESYAMTLNRQFNYQLQDARDAARNNEEDGLIDSEAFIELMSRLDAAGCPQDGNGSTLAEMVTMPTEDEAEEVEVDE